MAELGMDTEGMKPYPQMMLSVTESITTEIDRVTNGFYGIKWTGTDATNFKGDWHDKTNLLKNTARELMETFAGSLSRNITQQETASNT